MSGEPADRARRSGVPEASSADALARMRRQGRRNTKPELALRRILHAQGLRYRIDATPLLGMRRRADIIFTKAKVAVYVDGCFWHSCPIHGTRPRSNEQWWAKKLEGNRARDADTDLRLRAAGWVPLRFWEHEDPTVAAELVASTVRLRRVRPGLTASTYE